MPKIPQPKRTISQFIESQLPDFVKDEDPKFLAFLKAYYEWLAQNGTDVFECKIVDSTDHTIVLTDAASAKINYYQDMNIVCLNGPTKGHTRKVLSYEPVTRTIHVNQWEPGNVPPPNTRMVIRSSIHPGSLLELRDIDQTLDRFVDFYRNEFLYQIPGTILADKRNILKHIKDFYQARGTENSFRFLFRILFDQEIEFYYPKVDLFRASDARWYVEHVMKTTTTVDTFDFVDRLLIGVYSGATAKVESATQQYVAGSTITEFKLSNIDGQFVIDPGTGLPELVKIVYPVDAPLQSNLGSITDLIEDTTETKWEQAYQILEKLLVEVPGENYVVGETITIGGNGELAPATAIITAIYEVIYNGRCSPPPTTYYLEPFFGPNDFVETTGDPTKDKVCIPGLYFFSDVHSTFTDDDLLNSTEIKLSQNEVTVDDFFIGDEIALVKGSGVGQRRTIVSYNGTSKVATVDEAFDIIPDETTEYSITHSKGGIKSVKIVDFGLGFLTDPTITINTVAGSGAVLPPTLNLVGQTAGQWLMGRDGGVGGASTTTDSFASSNKIIQDSYYWQDFSYDLRVGETIDKYRDVVKSLLHPAGFKMFGTVLLKSKPKTDFLEIVQRYILELGTKVFDLDLKLNLHNETVMNINTITPQVVGMKNKDLDGLKFRAFPPNVRFNQRYPFPNQNYWTPSGPGNTQINNLKDIVIGDIVNFPNRRTTINVDAYVAITNGNSFSKVGPVGQNRATIARSRFKGFPPYEGFYQLLPSPNDNYWVGAYGGYGNTQIVALKDIVLSELIVNPQTVHSNICVDGDIQIYRNGQIPAIGNKVEYSFLEGIDPQIVYNVSPNSHGEYDGVLGSDILSEIIDGTYVTEGVILSAADEEIINATGVPINLKQCTVIVVAMAPSISTDMTVVSMIPQPTDNGFSIELRDGGGILFRSRYDNVEKIVEFPPTTVAADDFFMATLRFNDGVLSGNVNTSLLLNTQNTISTQFASYPAAPTTASAGWYFGQPSVNYTPTAQSSSLFNNAKYGANKFGQDEVSAAAVSFGYFDGYLCYAIFYDRALYDFELNFVYTELEQKLRDQRNVNLGAQTAYQTQLGNAAIRRTVTRTQTGSSLLKYVQTKTQTGLTAIQNTTTKTLIGRTAVQNTTTRTAAGVSRLRVTVPRTLAGTSAIRVTTLRTLTGESRIQLIAPQTVLGVSRIQATTLRTNIGISSLQATTLSTNVGESRIQITTSRTNVGESRIQITTLSTNVGESRIQTTVPTTLVGTSAIQATTSRTNVGESRIQITTPQTVLGESRIQTTVPTTLVGTSAIQATTLRTIGGTTTIS